MPEYQFNIEDTFNLNSIVFLENVLCRSSILFDVIMQYFLSGLECFYSNSPHLSVGQP